LVSDIKDRTWLEVIDCTVEVMHNTEGIRIGQGQYYNGNLHRLSPSDFIRIMNSTKLKDGEIENSYKLCDVHTEL
jgi:hypothetical protein